MQPETRRNPSRSWKRRFLRAGRALLAGTLWACAGAHSGPASAAAALGAEEVDRSRLATEESRWWRHVEVLADDGMAGRETGSLGFRRAVAYVVSQLKALGLRPGAGNDFEQPVSFVVRQVDEAASALELLDGAERLPAPLGEDAFLSARMALRPETSAELVFVGYGLSLPELHYDDLADLDLRGKIAVFVTGSPAEVPGTLGAFAQFPGERWRALRRAGVVGSVAILNPATVDLPWPRIAAQRAFPAMALADPELDDLPGEGLAVIWNPSRAQPLFRHAPARWEELLSRAQRREPLPRFALGLGLHARVALRTREATSSNVVALLPGADPRLRGEFVVVSAHLDHLGEGGAAGGAVHPGAMDNAAGVATVLRMAAHLRASPTPPRRSILFALYTGEEKGLLGSGYFAARPPVPIGSIVANLNIDMPKPFVPLTVLDVFGMGESDLGDLAATAAARLGVRARDDPEPLRNRFIRSDQFSFVRRGIPALAAQIGAEGAPEEEIMKRWFRERYHAPADDLRQPVDLAAAVAYGRVVEEIVAAIASAPDRPAWKPGSFFRRFAP